MGIISILQRLVKERCDRSQGRTFDQVMSMADGTVTRVRIPRLVSTDEIERMEMEGEAQDAIAMMQAQQERTTRMSPPPQVAASTRDSVLERTSQLINDLRSGEITLGQFDESVNEAIEELRMLQNFVDDETECDRRGAAADQVERHYGFSGYVSGVPAPSHPYPSPGNTKPIPALCKGCKYLPDHNRHKVAIASKDLLCAVEPMGPEDGVCRSFEAKDHPPVE